MDSAPALFAQINIPVFCLTGTEDKAAVNDVTPEQRQLPYQFMKAPHKFMMVLNGANHSVFGGQPADRKWDEQNKTIHAALIQQSTLFFWNAHLRDDPRAKTGLSSFQTTLGSNGSWSHK